MEEILASIRRIIEDSDAVRTPLEDESLEVGMADRTPDPVDAALDEVEAFRSGLEEAEAQPAGSPDSAAEPGQPAPVVQIHPIRPPEAIVEARSSEAAAPSEEPAPVESSPREQPDASVQPQAEMRPAIISDQTSRQVAAAFGELSEAFAASRRRSFDEMAEEMLRPMLQDWLDNNLPTLVEKLVREEIERVARGS